MEGASETLSAPRRIALSAEAAIPFAVLALDQLAKAWVRSAMSLNQTIPVLGDVLRLTYIHNEGAAFGLSIGQHSSIAVDAARGVHLSYYDSLNQNLEYQYRCPN